MAMQWAENYLPVVYEWFRTGVDAVPSMIPQLYNVMASNTANEYALGIGSAPTDQWDMYEASGRVANLDVDRGYATTFTHEEKAARFTLKRKHVDDDQMGLVQEALLQLGISAAQKREQDAASVFNNAFSASFVGADSVALCSASHPYGPDNTGSTQSNAGTAALSYANLVAARLAMRQFKDSAGINMGRIGNNILIPANLESTAIEITGANLKPGTANNDASATQGINYMVWDYLSDANNWFLIDPVWTKRYLRWYDRTPLESRIVEQTTTHVTYEFYMRYSFGWTHWAWLYGNNVT